MSAAHCYLARLDPIHTRAMKIVDEGMLLQRLAVWRYVAGLVYLVHKLHYRLSPLQLTALAATITSLPTSHTRQNNWGFNVAVNSTLPRVAPKSACCSFLFCLISTWNVLLHYCWPCCQNQTPVTLYDGRLSSPDSNWLVISYWLLLTKLRPTCALFFFLMLPSLFLFFFSSSLWIMFSFATSRVLSTPHHNPPHDVPLWCRPRGRFKIFRLARSCFFIAATHLQNSIAGLPLCTICFLSYSLHNFACCCIPLLLNETKSKVDLGVHPPIPVRCTPNTIRRETLTFRPEPSSEGFNHLK